MSTISDVGTLIQVTPWDELFIRTEKQITTVKDLTPFEFRVQGKLQDGQIFFGLYGPVVSGPDRYRGLICNIMIRADGSDWRKTIKCQANFKVGPCKAVRNHAYDFRHPEGTVINGFPSISRFGRICVVDLESNKGDRPKR